MANNIFHNTSGNISDIGSSVNAHQVILWLQTPVGVIIFAVNVIALIVLWKTKMAQANMRVLLASMAVSDASTGLLFVFNCLVFYYPELLTRVTCAVRFGGLQFFILVSLSNIALLAIDRGCIIRLPQTYPHVVKERHAVAASIIMWIFGILITCIIYRRAFANFETCVFVIMAEYQEVLSVMVTIYFLTIIILIFCYAGIIYHVREQQRKVALSMNVVPRLADSTSNNTHETATRSLELRDIPISPNPEQSRQLAIPVATPRPTALHRSPSRNRHLKTITLLLVAVLICYLPLMSLFAHFALHPSDMRLPVSAVMINSSLPLLVINSLINPLLYTWKIPECRHTFLKLFRLRR